MPEGKHYHLIQVGHGKGDFERVYLEMTSPEESSEDGRARYVEAQVKAKTNSRSRPKTVAKVRAAVEAKVEFVQACHPSSWRKAQAVENGTTYPAPTGKTRSRRR